MKGRMIRGSWSSNVVTDSYHRAGIRNTTLKLLTRHSNKSTDVPVNRMRRAPEAMCGPL